MVKKPDILAQDIITFVNKKEQDTKPLRDRMEETYNFWRLEYFDIDKSMGKYRTMVSAKPRVFCDKITSELAYGFLKLSLPIYKETKKERSVESMTEQTAYGLIGMADDRLRKCMLPNIQSQLAEDIPLRGFAIPRVWVYSENDHGENKTCVDVAIWDARNVYWDIGRKGLRSVCYVRYASKTEVEDTYDVKDVKEDAKGGVAVYNWWDDDWEVVVIGNDIVDWQENHQGYPPVLILPVGSSRMRQSSKHDDTIRDLGEDFASKGGRVIWPKLSEAMSYFLTTTALGTHPVQKLLYDGPQNMPEFESPTELLEDGNFIPLDTSKGQDVLPMFQATLPKEALSLYQVVGAEESRATAPDIFYGQASGQETAQGTAMLIHASMATLKNGQRAMEGAFAWIAGELIKQVKDGEFDIESLQGVDGKKSQFTVRPKLDQLVTDRRFVVQLVLESPQDILQNIGAADQLVKSGLSSRQTARDKLLGQLFPDPDAEEAIIDRETARRLAGIGDWEALEELIKDNPNSIAAWRMFARMQQEAEQGMAIAGQNVAGIPKTLGPGNMPGQAATGKKPPMAAMTDENERLANMGLMRGR